MAKQIKANSKYKGINVVATVYGNDDPEKSTTETQGLLQSNPTIKVIVAPTSVGIISAAQYVVARPELKGKVIVTGLGLPTSMAKYIKDGTAQAALWNVPDIGYMSVYAVANIASKLVKTPVKNGSSFSGGYLGSRKSFAGDNGPEIILGPGIIFTPENVDSFKF
jgi:rhamnose transport system substrate-binding protein